ncbi:S-layer homology domain-containing protein [Lachnospiraceae bacterium NSJ-143]|nr:S-layer homology domain-containing protein [Lachnospiraceae bacterium NSJ-143]
MKKLIAMALAVSLSVSVAISAFGAEYSDVSSSHWAYGQIQKASEEGFMSGMEKDVFGLGQSVTKAQFVSMVTRLFGWDEIDYQFSSINDNQNSSAWYHSAVETAAYHGAIENSGYFNPDSFITREEMAVILIKALGYDSLVSDSEKAAFPFTDVTENRGYIDLAYNFGIISGKSQNIFDPKGKASREEAAAMMVRCFEKLNSDTEFLHGFYAFSSYNQKEMASQMDAVSFGWSRMEYTNENGVVLDTLSKDGNEWVVPQGYEEIVKYLKESGVKTHLNVYMSNADSHVCERILNSSDNRAKAIEAIMEEMNLTYKKLGYNPYDGVTIDFENLKGSNIRENFNLFLADLKSELSKAGKSLYVAVQPALKDGSYFDGYDFKSIGETADKIIIMAYDYYPKNISQEVMDSGFTTTPVSPFDQVYHGLKNVCSAIEDKSKIVLGISISSAGWRVERGQIVNGQAMSLSQSTIINDIKSGAEVKYSEKYRNPYMNITDDTGNTVIWFENAQSVKDKINLAKMLGVTGVSVWRLGLIPEDKDTGMDIWEELSK